VDLSAEHRQYHVSLAYRNRWTAKVRRIQEVQYAVFWA